MKRRKRYPIESRAREISAYNIAAITWISENEELEDLYYLSIRHGIENRCQQLDINLSVHFYKDIDKAKFDGIDGLIAIGKFSEQQIKQLAKISEHIVFVDYSPDDDRYDSIVIDFEKATKKVIDYLLDKGHQNIGFLGGRESFTDGSGLLRICGNAPLSVI